MRQSFLLHFIIYFRHVSNICLSRKSQPLASSSNFNISQSNNTSHVDSPLSSCATQVPPILTPPSLEFSQSTTSSQSLSSSLNSPESYNFSKSSKRPRRSTTIEDELLHGLSALKPPVPAASDSVDHFCRSIADSLRMLDMKNRLSAEIEIMQLLHKFYN
ncbi:hypothetical protein ALC62_15031 [Cyphomyrmex costatus]|uniref:BESS domain-containing protein n=1 Tax=Cyphomyrmex costatus TaxID=456900 RepID=A0A151I836_9HYME|nr:hypothetical protein ALC62_15031 [Cyphomyrmex costatus]